MLYRKEGKRIAIGILFALALTGCTSVNHGLTAMLDPVLLPSCKSQDIPASHMTQPTRLGSMRA